MSLILLVRKKNKMNAPHALLINPWIYDYAAYDFWMKPLGLLYIASCLRKNGYHLTYLDCLNLSHPGMKPYLKSKSSRKSFFGSHPLYKERLENPPCLADISRHYGRYGLKLELFLEELDKIEKPEVILVSSMMTYWYPGPFKVIELVKQKFPEVPVLLGGIYASLCREHARKYSGADYILSGESENTAVELCNQITGWNSDFRVNPDDLDSYPYPAMDLVKNTNYACLMTSRGCPFHCTYCAHDKLSPGYRRRDWQCVFKEIIHYQETQGIRNFVFYDDALAINPETMLIPLLEEVVKQDLQLTFHTPNGLHIRGVTPELARLMYQSGFKTVRISLETSEPILQKTTGGKTSNEEFIQCCRYLHEAGYSNRDIGVYLLVMLPGQRWQEAESSIRFVIENGAYPYLSEFTPIPGTPYFESAKKGSPYDLEHEPLFQNNTICPCQWEGFTLKDLERIKLLRLELSKHA